MNGLEKLMSRKSIKRNGSCVFCGLLSLLLFVSSLYCGLMPAKAASYDEEYTVDAGQRFQEFDGWGTSLAWWANEVGDWTRESADGTTQREAIMQALFGEDGLDLNIARYNVGGGDNPAHSHMSSDRNMPGFRSATEIIDEDGSVTGYVPAENYVWVDDYGNILDWTQLPDANQLWVLNWIRQNCDDAITDYFSNSPPYWMTITGCSSGNGDQTNLLTGYEDDFVEYFLDVYEYLVSQGFEFDNLQPFNESSSGYWDTQGSQEGCDFSTTQKIRILSYLSQELKDRGIDAEYNFSDETNTSTAVNVYNSVMDSVYTSSEGMTGKDVLAQAGRLTYHIYSYERENAQQMYRFAQENGQEVWMSEVCYTAGEEYDPDAMDVSFDYATGIIDVIKYGGAEAYVFWQGMEDMLGQISGGTNYGLIQGVYYTQDEALNQGIDLASMGLAYQDYTLSKAYYVAGQFTKYIKQGYRIVSVDDENSLAAISPDGTKLVIVKQNAGDADLPFKLNFDGFYANSVTKIITDAQNNWKQSSLSTDGSVLYDTAGAYSMSTYVIEGISTEGASHFIDNSAGQYVGSLAEISSLGEEREQLYFLFDSSDEDEAYRYGNSLYTNDSEKYVVIRFYGTGLGVLTTKKPDAGVLSIWIDQELTDQPYSVQTLQQDAEEYQTEIRFNGLEEGWHTAYLSVSEGYFNFDGVFVLESADIAPDASPVLKTAAGKDGKISIFYEGTDVLSGYKFYAEYRAAGGEWKRTEQMPSQSFSFEPGQDCKEYEVRVVATNGKDIRISNSLTVFMGTSAKGVLYYVDAGTNNYAGELGGRVLGRVNSVYDQPFGADPVSGMEWGYCNVEGDSSSYFGAEGVFGSFISGDKTSDNNITYCFTIPEAGEYRFAFAFYDPWSTEKRTMDIKVSGDAQTGEKTLATALGTSSDCTLFCGTYVTTQDNVLVTVTIEKSPDGNGANPILSAIVITDMQTSIPMFAQYASNYAEEVSSTGGSLVLGSDFFAELPQTMTVTMSDGTTQEFAVGEEMQVTATLGTLAANNTLTALYTIDKYDMEIEVTFTVEQYGKTLYYAIDSGSDGTNPSTPGSKQSSSIEQKYEEGVNSWGYVGEIGDANWKDDTEFSSIREAGSDGTLTYFMSGFGIGEALILEVCANIHDWDEREMSVTVNGSVVDESVLLPVNKTVTEEYIVNADENGNLTVSFAKVNGDNPQIAYVKVYSYNAEGGASVPPQITTDKKSYQRTDTVQLSNLDPQAYVYVLDENDSILDIFQPVSSTMSWSIAKYLPTDSYSLRFTQAYLKGASSSTETLVDIPEVNVVFSEEYTAEAAVMKFVPRTVYGFDSLTLRSPDGVLHDLSESFFYRATRNGTYVLTMISNGITYTREINLETIDVITLDTEYSMEGWTTQAVSVTLVPTAVSGVSQVYIDGKEQSLQESYVLTSSENTIWQVKIVTQAGNEKIFDVEIGNIDAQAPVLSLLPDYTCVKGVQLNYQIQSLSGGILSVSVDGGEKEIVTDPGYYTAIVSGRYEFIFVNGAGISAEPVVYTLTYGWENAVSGKVTKSEDGVLTVDEGVAAKLYRAGDSQPQTELNISSAGKYYLELTANGETEIVVFSVEGAAQTIGSGEEVPSTNWALWLGIAAGVVVCAAVVVTVILVRRKKKA